MKKQQNVAQSLQASSRPTSPPPQQAAAGSEKNNSRPNLANSRKPSASNLAPNAPPPKASSPFQRNPAGSGSEHEAAGSGDEKSDGTRGRIKLKFTSKVTKTKEQNNGSGTAPHSRAGSPDVGSSFPGPESAAKNRAVGFDGDLYILIYHRLNANRDPKIRTQRLSQPLPNFAPAFPQMDSRLPSSWHFFLARLWETNANKGSRS